MPKWVGGIFGNTIASDATSGLSGVFSSQNQYYMSQEGGWVAKVSVTYLVVAGGGGGARGQDLVRYAGGGGGGSHLTGTQIFDTGESVSITVGAGGNKASDFGAASNGNSSSFGPISASGGGGSPGNPGGTGGTNAGNGGTGGPVGNPGAPGSTSSITGSPVSRSGGGGASRGGSGVDGGGNGGAYDSPGSDGVANRGGGGGGGDPLNSRLGGSGGSGVVILSYPSNRTISNPGGGLTYSSSPVGGNTVTTITAGTGNVSWS